MDLCTFSNEGKTLETISITQNLAGALPYLRDIEEVCTLWIDAVCVNQNDLEERSSHIRRMADIYTYALRVIIWLGLAIDDSL